MKYFSVRNRQLIFLFMPLPIRIVLNGTCELSKIEVSKVFSRSSAAYISRDTAGPTTGWSPFSWKGISRRNCVRLTAPRETPRVSSASCAIKHSNAAQLSLPRTWSERGTANLLDSEVLFVVKSRVLSLGFQRRSYILCISILLVFEPVYILR